MVSSSTAFFPCLPFPLVSCGSLVCVSWRLFVSMCMAVFLQLSSCGWYTWSSPNKLLQYINLGSSSSLCQNVTKSQVATLRLTLCNCLLFLVVVSCANDVLCASNLLRQPTFSCVRMLNLSQLELIITTSVTCVTTKCNTINAIDKGLSETEHLCQD